LALLQWLQPAICNQAKQLHHNILLPLIPAARANGTAAALAAWRTEPADGGQEAGKRETQTDARCVMEALALILFVVTLGRGGKAGW
jgi:hypothetical protein